MLQVLDLKQVKKNYCIRNQLFVCFWLNCHGICVTDCDETGPASEYRLADCNNIVPGETSCRHDV